MNFADLRALNTDAEEAVPALLGHWLSLAARVPLEPNDEPDAQVAGPARRLRQPVGAVPASTAVQAPSHVPNATVTLYVAVATADLKGFVSRLKRRNGATT